MLGWNSMMSLIHNAVAHYAYSLAILFFIASVLFLYFMNVQKIRRRGLVFDGLPGVLHSKPFTLQLRKKLKTRAPFYLILLTIDEIKTINTNGIGVRNELLQQVGRRLTNWLPPSGSACRLEGGEFLICLPFPSAKKFKFTGVEYLQEMETLLSAPYLIQHKLHHLSMKTGMAKYAGEKLTIDQLLSLTYSSLHQDTVNGMNHAVLYHEKYAEQIRRRTLIEVYLRDALLENQFSMQYQPQFELHSGKLKGFEAVLIWIHPELGNIAPDEFMPIGEEKQLLLPISDWMLRQACHMLRRMTTGSSPITISVPISSSQLSNQRFAEQIEDLLKDTGLRAERLELELMESMLMHSKDIADSQLNRLHQLGVRLVLNGVGNEYFKMKEISKLPFCLLKIDGSFIRNIGHPSEQQEFESLIHSVKQNRYEVLAEGLETYEQLVYLKKLRCDFAQGLLFSKPLPEAQLPSLIHAVIRE
ncbi:GGDEF domain-containing phosphodiesterase [Cohnella herbarum]|uniref:EAL domain-containing protein n=1 Tax=Cohnella herbarum TaxID=2728023 RepID=A0A7Z2VGL6_9BACL|nr:GGDEF domain-containing phosphodiesterase [Cohnella herbarum]QJD82651.1 EAL domain-containing protein [Cohnella herbarum]